MRVELEGVRIFADIEGSALGIGPDGQYREKPTLVLVHGGPGFDHSVFRPYYDRFADVAQVIYFDLAGHGRSDLADEGRWNLAAWGRDIKLLCDHLGVEKPVVVGVSFGGFVAMSYAAQFPDHPGALVLASTAARTDLERKLDAFEQSGGPKAREVAEAFWRHPDDATVAAYMEVCMPLYSPPDPPAEPPVRVIMRLESFFHFTGDGREMMTYDYREALGKVACPVLVVSGGLDPITPPGDAAEIMAALPPGLGRLAAFPGCGHGVERTDPEGYERLLREFLAEQSGS